MADVTQETVDELVVAARKLAVATDNAATVLSEEFEGMVTDPLRELNAVLAKFPMASSAWDGEIREEDLEIEKYTPTVNASGSERERGVRIRHTITGITRESYAKPTREENEQVVRKALTKAVKERFEAERAAG